MATRCRSPPESWSGRCRARWAIPNSRRRPLTIVARSADGHARQHERQLDVLGRRHPRNEMEELKDEADLLSPHPGRAEIGERRDVFSIELVDAGSGAIEKADDVQQRRLSRSRGSHDRDVLAGPDLQADVAQGVHFVVADAERPMDLAEEDHRRCGFSSTACAPAATPWRSTDRATFCPGSSPERTSVNAQFAIPTSRRRSSRMPAAL